jgi:NDP-sugar pyrophosphorylase family protein
MVLAAGYGTRLGEATRAVPKAMLDVHGRPLVEWILRHLAAQAIDEVALNVHFQAEQIERHLGDGSELGLRITYSREPVLLGTAGALRKMADFLGATDPFLVQYGDVVTDQPFAPIVDAHWRSGALATLLVHQRRGSNSVIELDAENRVTRFLERPGPEERAGVDSDWVNSGICVCSPELLERIPEGESDLPRDVIVPAVGEGRIFAVPLTGYRCAVDSPERLNQLRAAIADRHDIPRP